MFALVCAHVFARAGGRAIDDGGGGASERRLRGLAIVGVGHDPDLYGGGGGGWDAEVRSIALCWCVSVTVSR